MHTVDPNVKCQKNTKFAISLLIPATDCVRKPARALILRAPRRRYEIVSDIFRRFWSRRAGHVYLAATAVCPFASRPLTCPATVKITTESIRVHNH